MLLMLLFIGGSTKFCSVDLQTAAETAVEVTADELVVLMIMALDAAAPAVDVADVVLDVPVQDAVLLDTKFAAFRFILFSCISRRFSTRSGSLRTTKEEER